MKYGDSLHQRSIPEWGPYNVDYNDIKRLIKIRTTRGQAQAMDIPGQSGEREALEKFEKELYAELREQHQRIDLFVKSKSGEIKRRLSHLAKQVEQLEQSKPTSNHLRISVRRLEKFSKAEGDVLKAGEDVQSLSRFVGAQRLAFQKLLKKYKRWTGSTTLGTRFQRDVLGRQSSFIKSDFEPLLAQWSDVLAAVRAPFNADLALGFVPGGRERQALRSDESKVTGTLASENEATLERAKSTITTAALMHTTCETGSDVDMDTAFAISPFGRASGEAIYWVHPDNMVEIQVLLLQYSRLRKSGSPSSTPSPISSNSSRRVSLNDQNEYLSGVDDEAGVVVCDDLTRFASRWSSSTMDDSELPGNALEKAAASLRYSSSGEAVVVVGMLSENKGDGEGPIQKAKLKRKLVHQLFDLNQPLPSSWASKASNCVNELSQSGLNSSQSLENIRTWLRKHQDVHPLVHMQFKRTRFVGLEHSEARGMWATLDKDVSMKKSSLEQLNIDNATPTAKERRDSFWEKFPHAILQIRWEGGGNIGLIRALDESHLTERVRGFSLETHAIATLYKSQSMPPPSWLPLLNRDIRKIPAPTRKVSHGRTSSTQISQDSASTPASANSITGGLSSNGFSAQPHESSATSAPDMLESPPLSAFKKKRRSRREHPLRKQVNEPAHFQYQRYWNEFDDGEEVPENEAYIIFVDPNATSTFPGAATFHKIATAVTSTVRLSSEKVISWLDSRKEGHPEERRLFGSEHFPNHSHPEDGESSADDDDYSSTELPTPRRQYATFPDHPNPHTIRYREKMLSRACVASFIVSIILLIVATILSTTGRRKAVVTVDLGIVVGVTCSLAFACVGVGMMTGRTEDVGWVYRISVVLVFATVSVGSGLLLAIMGAN